MIKNAILSVSDKTGIVDLSKQLSSLGINLYSTGGTKKVLLENNISVHDISSLTGFQEILDGRVKTLHPKIHAGILAKRREEQHQQILKKLEIKTIDLVVVNLYPFEKKVSENASLEEVIENIDIGGPTLLRASAKNYQSVLVISHPKYYQELIEKLQQDKLDLSFREQLAVAAFQQTRNYDTAIEKYFSEKFLNCDSETFFYKKNKKLRYGENPHQSSDLFYQEKNQEKQQNSFSLASCQILHGKEMSYNNYLDSEAAIQSAFYNNKNTVAIVKHSNPCGYATGDSIQEALQMAWEGDIVSAFGSVIAVHGKLTVQASEFLKNKFIEIIIVEEYEEQAVEFLKKKSKNLRIIKINKNDRLQQDNYKILNGVLLKQNFNDKIYEEIKRVTLQQNSAEKKKELSSEFLGLYSFAYQTVKYIRSNAIAICHEYQKNKYMLIGMGAGQPNRVDALRKLAIPKAQENITRLYGKEKLTEVMSQCVLASDAFFPFADNVEYANEAGIKKIIQPGGSIRDDEVIATCNKYGIEMFFTGMRHFYH